MKSTTTTSTLVYVDNNGTIIVFNQDSENSLLNTLTSFCNSSSKIQYNSNVLTVIDENGEETEDRRKRYR